MPDNLSYLRIKKLSPLLINQLAAGEVVTRPASVVKELLENAIDAGATHIEVRITQGGMGMIEVVDNGLGIHPDDMVMAITRHATSKVADIANLHGISTLGFRGEALAATAAVSRLTLMSSHDDSGIGRQLHVAGVLAEVPKLIPVVRNRGTTITVKDLYFNVPARRGNLKSIATEFNYIESIVREVALARADVTLNLFHDNKKRLSLSADSTGNNLEDTNNTGSRLPLARLEQALGMVLTDHAMALIVDLDSLQSQSQPDDFAVQQLAIDGAQPTLKVAISSATITGWLWPVHDAQSTNATLPKLLYVNGRLIKEPIISNQLRQLAQHAQLANIGYALYFELPALWLNLNVHPAKQRIKISPLSNIMAHLSQAISLKLKSVVPGNFDTSNSDTGNAVPSEAIDNSLRDSATIDIDNIDISKDAAQTIIDIHSLGQPSGKYATANSTTNSIDSIFENEFKDNQVNSFNYNSTTPIQISSLLPQQQVQSSAQSYQHSIAPQSSTIPTANAKNTSFADKVKWASQNDLAYKTSSMELPHCLAAISDLDGIDLDSVDLSSVDINIEINTINSIYPTADLNDQRPPVHKNSLSSQPWLLFYWQNQLVLISEQVWQISLSSLFETSRYPTDESLSAAGKINQQLAHYTMQMSKQDLVAFTMDIERMLFTNAIKTLGHEQLVTFMLSKTSR